MTIKKEQVMDVRSGSKKASNRMSFFKKLGKIAYDTFLDSIN